MEEASPSQALDPRVSADEPGPSAAAGRSLGGDPFIDRPKRADVKASPVTLLVGAAAVVLFGIFGPTFWVSVAALVFLALIGGFALNLLLGTGGQLSLANAAFMGMGAVVAAVLTSGEAPLPLPVVLIASGAAAGVVALLVGLIALRLSGISLVLGTLALHFITVWVIREYQTATVGPRGFSIPRPDLFGFRIDSPTRWYFLLAIAALLAALVVRNLLRSRSGRAWRLVRDRDLAAAVIGINVVRSTLTLFVVTSTMIGVQGALFAYYSRLVSYENFTMGLIVTYLAIVIIGGLGSVGGTVLGAVFVIVVPYGIRVLLPLIPSWVPGTDLMMANVFAVEQVVFGLSVIAFMLFAPSGLIDIWRRAARALRRTPTASARG